MTTYEIGPRTRARVGEIVAVLGEIEFRRRVALMTRYDIDTYDLDEVVGLFIAARQGRVHPPEAGRRAVALFPTLPPRTPDDPCVDVSRTAVSH